MPQSRKPSTEEHNRPFFATVIGVVVGGQLGYNNKFVWWEIALEIIVGVFCHFVIRNQRVHAGSIMLAFLGSVCLGIAAGTFGVWLHN